MDLKLLGAGLARSELPLETDHGHPSQPDLEAQLSLCTWLLQPLLLRLVNLDVFLEAEPAGGMERWTPGAPGPAQELCWKPWQQSAIRAWDGVKEGG